MWCQKRITNQELLVRFGDGKHRFYLESVCGARVVEGELCDYCRNVQPQTRTQDVGTFAHGLVNGEYTKESHIYDSPWYHKKVKAYGSPTAEGIELAMEAQKRARAGQKTKKLGDLIQAPDATVAQPKQETKKQSPRTKKESKQTTPVPNVVEQLAVQSKEPIVTQIPNNSALVESMDTPLEVQEVIHVVLRPFTHNHTKFWRDCMNEKIYRRTKTGGRGECIGIWDGEEIQDADSD
jgi:hypothetical protein